MNFYQNFQHDAYNYNFRIDAIDTISEIIKKYPNSRVIDGFLYNKITDRQVNELLFKLCENGDIDSIQKLMLIIPNIDIHVAKYIEPDYVFRTACRCNHIDLAKWLKKNWPNIDHRRSQDDAIIQSIRDHNNKIVCWLLKFYTINDFPMIINKCFFYNNTAIVKHILTKYDTSDIKLSYSSDTQANYGTEFNKLINEHESKMPKLKSARNI